MSDLVKDKLIALRESIKNQIDEYNNFAKTNNVETSVGLLTKGGEHIYEVNEDGETKDGESFSEYSYSEYNQYGPSWGWFPSSLSC